MEIPMVVTSMAKRAIKNSKKVSVVTTIHRMAAIIGVLGVLAFSGCFDSSTEEAPPSLKPPPLPADCVTIGALAYDDWTKSDAGGQDALPSGEVNVDYLRCKACHGWDQLGLQGGYVRRSRLETRPNAGLGDTLNTATRNISIGPFGSHTEITKEMVSQAGTRSMADGTSSWDGGSPTGYMTGNLNPVYSSAGGLSNTQLECVTKFLNDPEARADKVFATIDTSVDPVAYTVVGTAEAASGDQYYTNFCESCHGHPMQNSTATTSNLPGKGGLIAYLRKDGKASELMHKMHWGIPNTTMKRAVMGNPSNANVADVILSLQEIVNAGLPMAFDDEVNTPVDTSIDISVLENDSDANGGTLSISSFDATATQGGSVVDNDDGSLKYTPPVTFEGIDTLTYTITDPDNNTDVATVNVVVGNASLVKGKAYFQDNCAICHAAGADDTTTAFLASDLALQVSPLSTDLSIYGGTYKLMGAYTNVPQQTVDDLSAYFSSL